ncbi:hypothetical protein FACHB389_10155 [Nostoc calcicola FACHB-389]|nr:hypothetical protein [Nostoc calcicola FACHB-3891]OKH37478.1 hypothetical protein FACHB389_10155 [Nostoc calcicola FACHB-389]
MGTAIEPYIFVLDRFDIKGFSPEISTLFADYKPLIIYTGLLNLWFDSYNIVFCDRTYDLRPIRV